MSEKRFTKCCPKIRDYGDEMSCTEVCDKLNELAEENEQLKKENKQLQRCINEIYTIARLEEV